MFEKAIRTKLRFPHKGSCTTEDLWDLTPTALDGVYKKLRRDQKEMEDDSLLAAATTGKTKLNLQVDIVKHIVGIKVAETTARKLLVEKREQKNRIMEIIAEKQDESLKGKSVEELTGLLDNL